MADAALSDLDAARAETTRTEHTFTTESGVTYRCKPSNKWSARVIRATRTGEVDVAIELLFGEDALDEFNTDDMQRFFEEISVAEGLGEQGNS